MSAAGRCVVTGAGGFIGGHLVRALLERGFDVCGVDSKPVALWCQVHAGSDNVVADLTDRDACAKVVGTEAFVFNLAADMGGMGFISQNDVACLNAIEFSVNVLRACANGAAGYLFTSSACVYPASRQSAGRETGLNEDEAYPADPPEGYGWEKLFSERLARAWSDERGLSIRLPRLHNVYGPRGAWCGGREKAPAAIARKLIMAKVAGATRVPIWGDGTQVRSFLYVDDCVDCLVRLAFGSTYAAPLNVGSDVGVSVGELFDLVRELVGVDAVAVWQADRPAGVAHRTADVSRAASVLGWRPSTSLREGMASLVRELEPMVVDRGRPRVVAAVRSGSWDLPAARA